MLLILDFGIVIYYHFLNLIYEGNNNCAFLLVCKCHNKFCSYPFPTLMDAMRSFLTTVAKPMPVPRSPNLSVALLPQIAQNRSWSSLNIPGPLSQLTVV
jgi:hypothetical protein